MLCIGFTHWLCRLFRLDSSSLTHMFTATDLKIHVGGAHRAACQQVAVPHCSLGTNTTANRRLTWRLTWLRRRTFRAHSFEEVLCLSARASPVRSAYRPIRHQLPTTRFVHAHDARRRLRRVEERVQLGVGCGEPLVVRTLHVVDIPVPASASHATERCTHAVIVDARTTYSSSGRRR